MTDIIQRTEVLQTHLGVFLQDEHVADYTKITGTEDLNCEILYSYPTSESPFDYEQANWQYRGQAAMVHKPNETAVELNGTTGYIDFGDNYDFLGTLPYSVGGWIRPDALVTNAYIISKDGGGANGSWAIRFPNTLGAIQTTRYDVSGIESATSANGVIVPGQWSFVVATFNGTLLKLYVNGVEVASITSTKSLPGNSLSIKMGRHASLATNYFDGGFYGWFVYNVALSASDILTAYRTVLSTPSEWHGNSIYTGFMSSRTGVQSFWSLNEYSGTFQDSRPAGVDGTGNGGFTRNVANPSFRANTGEIWRYRIGDGSSGDRQVYAQRVAFPLVAGTTGWTAWSLLYSGTHYAIDVFEKEETIQVVHAKSDGLYLNNSLKISLTGIVSIRSVKGDPGALYLTRVIQDSDDARTMNTYYVADITAASPTAVFDKINYRWPHQEMSAYIRAGSVVQRIRSLPYSAPSVRTPLVSDDLVQEYVSLSGVTSEIGNIYPMRGASGRAGVKQINRMWVSHEYEFPTDKTWLVYTERHTDQYQNPLSNLHCPVFMMKTGFAPDGWTEPQPLGFSVWGLAGAAWWGDHIIIMGNGGVWTKEAEVEETDLSNYALNAELSLPRGNEKATGSITLCNPDDVVGQILGMASDSLSSAPQKRIKVVIGQYRSTSESWEDTEVNDWWVAEAHRVSEDDKRQVLLKLGDAWQRLENPFKDPYYFPGHLATESWKVGGDQSLTDWYTPTGQMTRINATDADGDAYLKLRVSKGWCIYTRWKGAHGRFRAHFVLSSASPALMAFRWVDVKNHWRVQYSGSSLKLVQVVNGVGTILQTTTVTSGQSDFYITIKFRFGWITYDLDGQGNTYQETGTARNDQYGFVAIAAKSSNVTYDNVSFQDYDQLITTSSLIKFLLIYAGYFQFFVEDDLRDIEQMGVLWGPQTDLLTPAKALERLLEGNQQDVIWREHSNTNGRGEIAISQFEDTTIAYDIDDEIISVDQADVSELRPNIIAVDGNEDSWTEYSRSDLFNRGSPVNRYLDMPELDTLTKVKNKAQEEKTLASKGNSLGGLVVWRPWFHKMDAVSWTDHDGNYYTARIEGMNISVDQGVQPFQHVEMDLTPIAVCDPETDPGTGPGSGGSGSGGEVLEPADFIALDDFDRDDVGSTFGTAVTGGVWTLTPTTTPFSVSGGRGRIATNTNYSERLARLAAVSLSTPIYLQAQFQISTLPDTGTVKFGFFCRYINSSNYYRINWVVDPNGKSSIHIIKAVAGVTSGFASIPTANCSASTKMNVRAWVRGTNPTYIAVKWWKSNEQEPDNWLLAAHDSTAAMQAAGSLGIFYMNAGTSGATTVGWTDDFKVTEAPAT